MGGSNGGLRIDAISFRGSSKDRGSLWLLLSVVVSGVSVSVGINPSRYISASDSYTTSESCRYHHSCSTNTMVVNVPSATSTSKSTILMSNQDRLESYQARLSIPQSNCTCVLGCRNCTTSAGLSFKRVLDSITSLSSVVPWPSSFGRSNILGKDASNRSICIVASTSSKVCGLLCIIPPHVVPFCCSGLTGSWISLPVFGAGSG